MHVFRLETLDVERELGHFLSILVDDLRRHGAAVHQGSQWELLLQAATSAGKLVLQAVELAHHMAHLQAAECTAKTYSP